MARRTAQKGGAKPARKMPTGRPFTGKDDPRRNNGGVPKEAREFKRALVEKHGQTILDALIKLVKKGNAVAVVRASEHVIGRPTQAVELTGKDGGPVDVKTNGINLSRLTNEQLLQLDAIIAAAESGGGSSGVGEEESPPLRP